MMMELDDVARLIRDQIAIDLKSSRLDSQRAIMQRALAASIEVSGTPIQQGAFFAMVCREVSNLGKVIVDAIKKVLDSLPVPDKPELRSRLLEIFDSEFQPLVNQIRRGFGAEWQKTLADGFDRHIDEVRFAKKHEITLATEKLMRDAAQLPRLTSQKERVVFPLYGIRTRGEWQRTFVQVAEKDAWRCRLKRWNFGRFSLYQFLWPFGRAKKIRWFEETYNEEVNDRRLDLQAGERPSVVAHSFGTYIVGWALYEFKHLKLNKVILCGSILPKDFPWDVLLRRGQVRAVRNEFGVNDFWVKVVRFFVPKTGASGADGFTRTHSNLDQERFEFAHSQYFSEGHMEAFWMPFLNRTELPLAEESINLEPPKLNRPLGLYLTVLFVLATLTVSMVLLFHDQPPVSLSQCGFFSDDYGSANTWRPYNLKLDQGKRLWVGCQVEAHEDVEVSSIQTAAGTTYAIAVGYEDQRFPQPVRLEKTTSRWLSVVFDPESADRHLLPFAHSSKFVLILADGKSPVSASLPPLPFPLP